MKKIIIGGLAAAATAAALMGAGTANAITGADASYDTCVGSQTDLYTRSGASFSVYGRQIAGHISAGIRTPLQERNWVYHNTGVSVDVIDANVLVNCATEVYLGFDSNGNAV